MERVDTKLIICLYKKHLIKERLQIYRDIFRLHRKFCTSTMSKINDCENHFTLLQCFKTTFAANFI